MVQASVTRISLAGSEPMISGVPVDAHYDGAGAFSSSSAYRLRWGGIWFRLA